LLLEPRSVQATLHAPQPEFLEAFAGQAAFAFERARLSEEAQAAALRAETEQMRGSLLSAVSHDLRTPLASITGAASSLRDDPALRAEVKTELLETICEEADRLERLVANLLDMTRIESGAVVLKKEWLPLEEAIGSAFTRLENKLGARAIHISLPADLPLLLVDPLLLEQVFVNLIENAAKYTPQGSPIEVNATVGGEDVVIDVLDRGPGLTSGTEEHLFEKFYRGTHVGARGIGLGLAICRWIVEAHGGQIRAQNREGGGTRFRMTIPLTKPTPLLEPESSANKP
jgi:two-component system sensor histidine kinase KdpD